jgi:pyruvate dehydrogenase E1 component
MTDLSLVHTLDAILSRDTHDLDPAETAEWRDALDALTTAHGPSRARFILDALLAHARRNGVNWLPSMTTPYVNSIPLEAQPPFPGDLAMEQRLAALMRWNALAMVMRANQVESGGSAELGGHIASYASAADLFEVGFNHFFRARNDATSASATSSSSSRIRRPASMRARSSKGASRPTTSRTTARS